MSEVPKQIRVVAPSVVGVGETFSIGVAVLTEPKPAPNKAAYDRKIPSPGSPFNRSPRGILWLDNVAAWCGDLATDCGADADGPPAVSFTTEAGNRRAVQRAKGFCFNTPGIKFIKLRDEKTGLEGIGNAVQVTAAKPAERLFWGDLHVHTIFTDGLRCPEELYFFARDEAFLDLCALADHSEGLTDAQWNYFAEVANQFNEPGRFATLLGGEWTSMKYGHHNYYYAGDKGPILRSTVKTQESLTDFYAAVKSAGGLVVPHHPANVAMGVDWSLGHDPEIERLVEIYSVWGCSERPADKGNPLPIRAMGGEKPTRHVVDALRLGRKLGFIGSGDIHDGRPGDETHRLQTDVPEYAKLHGQGLVAVWVPELNRRAVFDALWNRRCYAATNKRTLLRFSIAGQPMGSLLGAVGENALSVEAAAEAPIARVDLVRNGEDFRVLEPAQREVRWDMTETMPREETNWYVRVTRQDGHMAWSSPIWTGCKEGDCIK